MEIKFKTLAKVLSKYVKASVQLYKFGIALFYTISIIENANI